MQTVQCVNCVFALAIINCPSFLQVIAIAYIRPGVGMTVVAVVVALADDFMPTMLILCTQIQRTLFDPFLGAWPAGYTLFCGY